MAAHIHGKRRYYGKMKGSVITFMLLFASTWSLKWAHTTKITCEVKTKIKKGDEIQQVHVLCVDSYVFVVLCMLVGSTFSININEWAQAEKCLAGWTRPVTETEDEAVLWDLVSCEWRLINCDTGSISEGDGRLMLQLVTQGGWWVYSIV